MSTKVVLSPKIKNIDNHVKHSKLACFLFKLLHDTAGKYFRGPAYNTTLRALFAEKKRKLKPERKTANTIKCHLRKLDGIVLYTSIYFNLIGSYQEDTDFKYV